jgi:hypothetical protein
MKYYQDIDVFSMKICQDDRKIAPIWERPQALLHGSQHGSPHRHVRELELEK